MQNNAIEYARQMQKKASDFNEKNEKISDINHIFKNEEQKSDNSQQGVKNIFNSANYTHSKSDNDILLILALILLLSSDGGDKMLMLALLYIMT